MGGSCRGREAGIHDSRRVQICGGRPLSEMPTCKRGAVDERSPQPQVELRLQFPFFRNTFAHASARSRLGDKDSCPVGVRSDHRHMHNEAGCLDPPATSLPAARPPARDSPGDVQRSTTLAQRF